MCLPFTSSKYLSFQRTLEGLVKIEPVKSEFGWKPHGEDIAKNLNMNYRIHYTVDGINPTVNSPEYTQPIFVQGKTVKAVALSEGITGTETSQEFGLLKKK